METIVIISILNTTMLIAAFKAGQRNAINTIKREITQKSKR